MSVCQFVIDRVALAKQGDNVLGSVCLSVCPRGVGLHVYYIHFGQYIHPIGSDPPLWAAGEYTIIFQFST